MSLAGALVAITVQTNATHTTDAIQISAAPALAPPSTTEALPTTTTEPPFEGWVDPASSGQPWSDLGAAEGLLTFRGNPTRSHYGSGPMPTAPKVQWTYNIGCSNSSVGSETKSWCGTGWTGQPTVFHPPGDDSAWWLAFGGYNRKVNFLDPGSGEEVFPAYETGDIIKGSVTIDPDGFPLLYTGSRDDHFHVVALDRDQPEALWKLSADAVQPVKWNNDWDGSALVIDDYLFEGGENSRFFIVKLNRHYDADGKVAVDPEIVFSAPGWDDELIAAVGEMVSIESSVAISGNTLYFANSGGLVQGWDLSMLAFGAEPTRTFRYWTGDDTDATIVIDEEGMLYVGSQFERGTERSMELGQVFKLDPTKPEDPLVWSVHANSGIDTGIWATPALHQDLLIVSTHDGHVLGLDRASGDERWSFDLPGPLWQSPVVVDDVLVQGDCNGGLHGYDVSDTAVLPPELWTVELEGCIESTPAAWDGRLYVGTRSGQFYAIGDG